MMGGDRVYWQKRFKEIEGLVLAETKHISPGNALEDIKNQDEEDEIADFIDEAEGKKRKKPEDLARERYEAERRQHFMNAMIGCSWMNIFNCDVTRAMANLPRPDNSPRSALLILARGNRWNYDGPTFIMPAIALLKGFDLCPNYDCVKLTDLQRYDTIMLLDGVDGVTSTLVKKINAWLRSRKNGLLYVCGNVNTRKVLFPELTFDSLKEKFLWEDFVQAIPGPRILEDLLDPRGRKTGKKQMAPGRLGTFRIRGAQEQRFDDSARLRYSWQGEIIPLITSQRKPVLALWRNPKQVTCTVLFEGVSNAGPVYTGALEKIMLELDRKRGSTVKRNRYWGHITWETEEFIVDVATSGYRALQAARPRRHQGVDIITGVINPEVQHNECALVFKDYVGPYAGGKGDWAVMAASELRTMELLGRRALKVHARGVTRVTHIVPEQIILDNAGEFERVQNQLMVWERMWEGRRAYLLVQIPGGRELHFFSNKPVLIRVVGQ